MTKVSPPSDLTDLSALRRYIRAADPEDRLDPLGLERLTISDDVHLGVADVVGEALRDLQGNAGAGVVILKDDTSILRAGEDLTGLVEKQLAGRFRVEMVYLRDGHQTLHADETVLDQATRAVSGADAIVTVGSGTITDIGKVASDRSGRMPLVAVQTAASVDGFTDNVSVVLKSGVKRTIPSVWPHAVLADTITIGGAPHQMNMAGFGEAITLFTAPADWYLASLVGLDTTFHPAALDILIAAGGSPGVWADGVAKGDPAAVEKLVRLLAVRGMVTGIIGTTACLSGVEHVVSHMLDLHQMANGRPIGLHGAQVGIGTIIAATAWHHAMSAGVVTARRLRRPDLAVAEQRVRNAFGGLGEDGAIADECWADYRNKLVKIEDNWELVTRLVSHWQGHADDISAMILPVDDLKNALIAAKAPATFADADPSFPAPVIRWAIANCHLMRNRFTLVDLLDLLGVWNDDLIDRLSGLVDGSGSLDKRERDR